MIVQTLFVAKARVSALHSVSLLLVRVSGYPVEGALDDGRNFRRGWRSRQMRPLESGAILICQPAEINLLSVRRGPRHRAAHLLSLFVFLAGVLLHALLLEGYPVGALPFREEATVRADVLLLPDDGYRLIRRRYYCRQAQQDNYVRIHPERDGRWIRDSSNA